MKRFATKFFSLVIALSLALGMIGQITQPVQADGSISLTTINTAYTQDFNTIATTGTANGTNTLPTGWMLFEIGTSSTVNQQYAAGTGSSTGGDTYSFGASGSSERAFGDLLSGTNTPTIGASFTNNTGELILSLDISYTGEQWRLGVTNRDTIDRLDFQYSMDATSLATGNWLDFDPLDFSTPNRVGTAGARDGNSTENRTVLSSSITGLNIANGSTFWIRWSDFNVYSSDDGLAVDDFSLTPTETLVDDSPSVSSTDPTDGTTNIAIDSNISVTFSEAVDVADGWYDVTCSASGTHSALVSGASDTYTIDPDADFSMGEVCTVTLKATKITDQDLLDPGYAMLADYSFGFTTYVDVCSTYTPIYDIQGSGLSAAIMGTVTTNGVVVGDFQNNTSIDNGNLNGFHIQDPTGDGNPLTSDGIFIYKGSTDVVLGDRVSVTGSVSEYKGLTEITASAIVVCSSGETVAPTPISLPVTSIDALEPFEGMLVTFPQDLIISEYFNYDRYGEIVLTSTRHMTPTALYEPGSLDAATAAQQFLLDRITLDDGRSAQNPDPAIHPNGNVFDLTNLFRGGDIVQNVTGVIDYSNSLYRLQPTQGAGYIAANTRPDVPPEVGGTLKVVSMNTLNYFSTIDSGADNCGPLGDQECRGADTDAEFLRQHDKLVAAISTMNPDVAGLIEIENNVNDEALQTLVDGLNAVMGAGAYDYIHTGIIGTDAIKVALIYKPASVSLVGDYAILDSSVDPRFLDNYNRPVLAQSFRDATGGVFTVAVNHLKSKGSACVNDPDLGDGAGNCNLTRQAAAQALVDWLDTVPTGSGDKDVMIIGDLNSYDKEDPIDAIIAGPDDTLGTFDDYVDMTFLNEGEHAYSYVFDGQIGYLDFAMTATLADQVTGTTTWHVNADEPDLIDYDMSFKADAQDAIYAPDFYRYSDHDPVIIGLALIPTYAFVGFNKPVENLPEVNKVNAGTSIPVKFSLSGEWGMDIFEYEVPLVVETACEFTQESIDLNKVTYIDRSKLLYDSKEDQYIYNWTTSKEWSGTCRMLTIVLNDGSIHQAAFSFK